MCGGLSSFFVLCGWRVEGVLSLAVKCSAGDVYRVGTLLNWCCVFYCWEVVSEWILKWWCGCYVCRMGGVLRW